jgi:hypothetical protein
MAKPAAARRTGSASSGERVPVVGAREPCPCGSGRRYKACHGREAAHAGTQFVARPFEGLAAECDWVALREIVPAATATLTLTGKRADREVTLATVLPLAWPAMVRTDGAVLVGLQVTGGSGDASRDVADALLRALDAEPGTPIPAGPLPGPGPRLQDVLDPLVAIEVHVREGFDFWLDGVQERTADVTESMERANEAVVPTARLESVEAAYWCDIGGRRHLRWVLPHDEEQLLAGLARLAAADQDGLGDGSRYVGSFRAHGLMVPVWDLAAGTEAGELEEPAAAFATRLGAAMAESKPLDGQQRRALAELRSRQLTLR